ncbi:hypothetical protein ILYODFUR_013102, partial [Ilyodon furcidens]
NNVFGKISGALATAGHAASSMGMFQNLLGASWQQETREKKEMGKVKRRLRVLMVGRKVRTKVSRSPWNFVSRQLLDDKVF